ncbi:hypothetical protein BD770DRAFT_394910 [Pilaira anomala]|nr:hypothetical protein BD770DRAFT_394910 [Pilaira anomala]
MRRKQKTLLDWLYSPLLSFLLLFLAVKFLSLLRRTSHTSLIEYAVFLTCNVRMPKQCVCVCVCVCVQITRSVFFLFLCK